jgi:hypothetical protein
MATKLKNASLFYECDTQPEQEGQLFLKQSPQGVLPLEMAQMTGLALESMQACKQSKQYTKN